MRVGQRRERTEEKKEERKYVVGSGVMAELIF
jgi:hypothetical protein